MKGHRDSYGNGPYITTKKEGLQNWREGYKRRRLIILLLLYYYYQDYNKGSISDYRDISPVTNLTLISTLASLCHYGSFPLFRGSIIKLMTISENLSKCQTRLSSTHKLMSRQKKSCVGVVCIVSHLHWVTQVIQWLYYNKNDQIDIEENWTFQDRKFHIFFYQMGNKWWDLFLWLSSSSSNQVYCYTIRYILQQLLQIS